MWRAALLALSALATGVAVSRAGLRREIDRRKISAIEEAAIEARREIKSQASAFIAESLGEFLRRAALKATFIVLFWALHYFRAIDDVSFSEGVLALLGVYLVWDAIRLYGPARFILVELRRNGWRPQRALSELVATRVLQSALEAAGEAPRSWWRDAALALAGRNHDEISREVALAVADIARATTWNDLWPFIRLALAKATAIWILYALVVVVATPVYA